MKGENTGFRTGDGSGLEADAVGESTEDGAPQEGPRVVDRRRVREDGGEESAGATEEVPRVPAYVERLQAKVAAAEEKLRQHIERIDKETADFRARQERETERRAQEAKRQAVSGFLGVADDLARATAAAGGGEREQVLETLVQGIRMIQGRFFQELSNLGVEPLAAMGAAFNPEEHEAVRMIEVSDKAQDGLVVEELASGYRMGGVVVRPARVSVGRYAG